MEIRLARREDAGQILDIYTPYVNNTVISFETVPPTLEEMESRICRILENKAWIVNEESGEILGYAYASKHRDRSAYRWSVDVSVYVRENHHGIGIGKALYKSLFEILKLQGYCNAYAGICLPNEKSVGIHEYFGFKKIAHYSKVGYKFGEWYDTGWWELFLQSHEQVPREPISISEIGTDELKRIFILE